MPWSDVTADWPRLVDHLMADFRHFDRSALERVRGDRVRLEAYLAETHLLTRREASETLDLWLRMRGRRVLLDRAA